VQYVLAEYNRLTTRAGAAIIAAHGYNDGLSEETSSKFFLTQGARLTNPQRVDVCKKISFLR
jgi:hypothetical protein